MMMLFSNSVLFPKYIFDKAEGIDAGKGRPDPFCGCHRADAPVSRTGGEDLDKAETFALNLVSERLFNSPFCDHKVFVGINRYTLYIRNAFNG